MRDQDGFTLIELLVIISLSAILMTLSAAAVRQFWLRQSLDGAAADVRAQMRQLQQQAESESHPLVYGAWFVQDSSTWGIVKYNAATGNCSTVGTRSFDTAVTVSGVTGLATPGSLLTPCRNALQSAGVPNASGARIAFFYARGTATAGSITVRQPSLGKTATVTVGALTGRVS